MIAMWLGTHYKKLITDKQQYLILDERTFYKLQLNQISYKSKSQNTIVGTGITFGCAGHGL